MEQARQDGLTGAGAAADLIGRFSEAILPGFASATAAASPLGPLPTTTAVLMPPIMA